MENTNINNSYTTSPFTSENNPDFLSQYINVYTHKGIFHPEPNIFICKAHCCCKYIGLYLILFSSFFGIFFPVIGFINNLIVLTIIGSGIFLFNCIIGVLLLCLNTIEVKFTFSHPVVEITTSSMCRTKNQIFEKSEISEIFFEYTEKRDGIFEALHIKFNNGIENIYFKISSRPPCFTKNEVDYFNNEIKKLLNNIYNSY